MAIIDPTEAAVNTALSKLPSVSSIDEFRALVNSLDASAKPGPFILYSGSFPEIPNLDGDPTSAGKVAESLAKQIGASIINDTARARFLGDDKAINRFMKLAGDAGANPDVAYSEQFFDNDNAFWREASRQFVASADGEGIAITGTRTRSNPVMVVDEIPTALANPKAHFLPADQANVAAALSSGDEAAVRSALSQSTTDAFNAGDLVRHPDGNFAISREGLDRIGVTGVTDPVPSAADLNATGFRAVSIPDGTAPPVAGPPTDPLAPTRTTGTPAALAAAPGASPADPGLHAPTMTDSAPSIIPDSAPPPEPGPAGRSSADLGGAHGPMAPVSDAAGPDDAALRGTADAMLPEPRTSAEPAPATSGEPARAGTTEPAADLARAPASVPAESAGARGPGGGLAPEITGTVTAPEIAGISGEGTGRFFPGFNATISQSPAASNILKGAGVLGALGIGVDAGLTGYNAYQLYNQGDTLGAGREVTGFGGRLGGALAGAQLFGELGAFGGPWVALGGALLGGVGGAIAGDKGIKYIYDTLTGYQPPQAANTPSQPTPGFPDQFATQFDQTNGGPYTDPATGLQLETQAQYDARRQAFVDSQMAQQQADAQQMLSTLKMMGVVDPNFTPPGEQPSIDANGASPSGAEGAGPAPTPAEVINNDFGALGQTRPVGQDQATSATDASINGGTPTPADIVANDFAALDQTQPTAPDQTASTIGASANAGAPTPSDIIASDFAALGQTQPTGQDQATPTTDAAPPPAPDAASTDVTAPAPAQTSDSTVSARPGPVEAATPAPDLTATTPPAPAPIDVPPPAADATALGLLSPDPVIPAPEPTPLPIDIPPAPTLAPPIPAIDDFAPPLPSPTFSPNIDLSTGLSGSSDLTGSSSFDSGLSSSFDTGLGSSLDTGLGSSFDTGPGSSFDSGLGSSLDTGPGSSFDSGLGSSLDTGLTSSFDSGTSSLIPSSSFDSGLGSSSFGSSSFGSDFGSSFSGGFSGGDAGPVVLDLSGQGIQLTDQRSSDAAFDTDGNGVPNRIAWTVPGEGLLAFDADGSGTVNSLPEIQLSAWSPGARTDLEGLAAFDSNHDAALDAGDQDFSRFGIWTSPDGASTPGDFQSLVEAGVKSISLASDGQRTDLPDGSTIHGTGTFTRTDGTTGKLADVALAYGPDIGIARDQLAGAMAAARPDPAATAMPVVLPQAIQMPMMAADLHHTPGRTG